MKLVRSDNERLVFDLSRQECLIVRDVLALYPLVPPGHHVVARGASDERGAEWQRLLDEALAEQRAANKQQLQAWLATADRFTKMQHGYELTIERTSTEWLLQVLNDIRVGSWILLGSPEALIHPTRLKKDQVRTWVAMEVAGYLQTMLVENA